MEFQIFGSKSSKDLDVMVFVDSIESIEESHQTLKSLDTKLVEYFKHTKYKGKEINSNICVIQSGLIVDCFKGTFDECNNSLYHTYDNHIQPFSKKITKLYNRSSEFLDVKLNRVLRHLISFHSRTHLREPIKKALRGDLHQRLSVFKMIDYTILKEFPKKKESLEDIYKVISFQLAQSILLSKGVEIYSKEEVSLTMRI